MDFKYGEYLFDEKVKEVFIHSVKWELAIQLNKVNVFTKSRYRLATKQEIQDYEK